MRFLVLLFGASLAIVFGLAVLFRLIPMDAATWHVEPSDVTPPTTPNFTLRAGEDAPVIPAPLGEVAERLEAAAAADGARLLAGSLASGHATYVARSRIMGFPDAISLRLTEVDGATRVDIFSRSRYGQSDLGVNDARVARWLAVAAGTDA